MKRRSLRSTVFLLISVSLTCTAVLAQGKSGLSPRGLMRTKRADAVSVKFLRERDGAKIPVDPAEEFHAGDLVRVAYVTNFDCYIYIVNITPSGKMCLMFPATDERNNKVLADEVEHFLPRDPLKFDDETGTEVLKVLVSREPIPYFDEQMSKPGGCFADDAAEVSKDLNSDTQVVRQPATSVPTEPVASVKTQEVAPPAAQPVAKMSSKASAGAVAAGIDQAKTSITSRVPGLSSLRPRGVVIERVKIKGARKTTDTVIAIPATQGGPPPKLQQGEVLEFEIAMKHT